MQPAQQQAGLTERSKSLIICSDRLTQEPDHNKGV
jgi:hypothetical protein